MYLRYFEDIIHEVSSIMFNDNPQNTVFVDKLQLIEIFDMDLIEDCNIYNFSQLMHELVNMEELMNMEEPSCVHEYYSFISYISFTHSVASSGDMEWNVVLNRDQFSIKYTLVEIK